MNVIVSFGDTTGADCRRLEDRNMGISKTFGMHLDPAGPSLLGINGLCVPVDFLALVKNKC